MTKMMLMSLPAVFLIGGCCSDCDCCGDATTPTSLSLAEDEGWTVLFDGSNTDQWRGFKRDAFPDQGWEIDGETLHKIAGAGGGDIITVQTYDDFELTLEWKVAEGANSGIFYNVAEEDSLHSVWQTGPEYQILDDDKHHDGGNELTSAAALYALIACDEDKELAEVGDWNTTRIVIDGDHVEHYLNGELVVEYDLGSDELNALIANSKFKDMARFAGEDSGHIALQDHGDDVWFRNIRIREID